MIPISNRLPIGTNKDLVFALENLFRDFVREIEARGYKSIPYQEMPATHDLTMLGKTNRTTAGFTLEANIFSPTGVEGHVFNVYNDSAAAITATQGSGLTLRLGGTTTTGNRTLAARGMMWVWYPATNVAVVGGHVT